LLEGNFLGIAEYIKVCQLGALATDTVDCYKNCGTA